MAKNEAMPEARPETLSMKPQTIQVPKTILVADLEVHYSEVEGAVKRYVRERYGLGARVKIEVDLEGLVNRDYAKVRVVDDT